MRTPTPSVLSLLQVGLPVKPARRHVAGEVGGADRSSTAPTPIRSDASPVQAEAGPSLDAGWL